MNPKAYDILIVDDELSMREFLEIILTNEGYSVCCAESGEEALEILRSQGARVFIQDLRMGGLDGMELLQQAREVAPETPVLVMTAYSTSDVALEAMRQGSFDFLRKPFQNEEVKGAVSRALASTNRDQNRNRNLRQRMVGNTPVMRELFEMVEKVAPTNSTVLVTGESGCGKELIARAIHDGSNRNDHQFIAVNCSAFTEGLLESELFGHVKGAFTGAVEERKGVFVSANGGTLFLDEVADMSLSTQVRILRALEDRRVIPVGGDSEVETDVRIIAATNKDLTIEVQEGRFREDLFYRLNVIPMHLPPLRDRKEDLPLLAGHFIRRHAEAMGKPVSGMTPAAHQALSQHDWPGNVRELENVIQRQVALCQEDLIDELSLVLPISSSASVKQGETPFENVTQSGNETETGNVCLDTGMGLEDQLIRFEAQLIRQALQRCQGNQTRAAELLGVSYRQFRYKVSKLNLQVKSAEFA
ncbi:hypothetical protein CBD41_03700 [bacterium TMED181]|nr:Fis family transcriptional regulator [Planctomycetota bacterium]OUW45590.1 MAG: hypothetical protein CBD41_03700 [bacterium TMED181]